MTQCRSLGALQKLRAAARRERHESNKSGKIKQLTRRAKPVALVDTLRIL